MATMEEVEETYKALQILRLCGWGMKERMRRLVSQYRATGDIIHLEEAITQPRNRQDRIMEWISENGAELLDEYLATLGLYTRQQLNTFVQNMVAYGFDLYTRQQDGESPDSLATDIETNIGNPADRFTRLAFPHSAAYLQSGDLYGR